MLSVLINTHLLIAARDASVGRFFFSSSACVYAADEQVDADVTALKESDAYLQCRKTAMAGRSCSASACVGTSARTSALRRASPATTTSTESTAPTTADARRPRLPSAASCEGCAEWPA